MLKGNSAERRDDCPGGLIVFPNCRFGVDSTSFQKIKTREEMTNWCAKCKLITDCSKALLFQSMMQDPEADRLTFNQSSMN